MVYVTKDACTLGNGWPSLMVVRCTEEESMNFTGTSNGLLTNTGQVAMGDRPAWGEARVLCPSSPSTTFHSAYFKFPKWKFRLIVFKHIRITFWFEDIFQETYCT